MHVLFTVAGVRKTSVASFNLTLKRFFACVDSLVYLQVFGASEEFTTSGKWTGEGFLSRMNSHMINQLVLGFERFLFSRTIGPVTSVICDFRSSHMLHRKMSDNIVEGVEELVAHLLGVLVDPLA